MKIRPFFYRAIGIATILLLIGLVCSPLVIIGAADRKRAREQPPLAVTNLTLSRRLERLRITERTGPTAAGTSIGRAVTEWQAHHPGRKIRAVTVVTVEVIVEHDAEGEWSTDGR